MRSDRANSCHPCPKGGGLSPFWLRSHNSLAALRWIRGLGGSSWTLGKSIFYIGNGRWAIAWCGSRLGGRGDLAEDWSSDSKRKTHPARARCGRPVSDGSRAVRRAPSLSLVKLGVCYRLNFNEIGAWLRPRDRRFLGIAWRKLTNGAETLWRYYSRQCAFLLPKDKAGSTFACGRHAPVGGS